MAGRRVDRLWHPRGGPVAVAVVGRAKVRAALHDPPRDPHVRCAWIVAVVLVAPPRVVHRAARALDLAMVPIPVGGPLPDVAGHVVEAETVRRERPDGGRPLVTILRQILPGKRTLPRVGLHGAARRELVAPRVGGTIQTA